MIEQQYAQIIGQTLVNFISAQTGETWHLVETVDRATPSGERWAAVVRSVFVFLTEKTQTIVFTPARGERQICRISGHTTRFVVTTGTGEIDFDLTKRLGLMTDKTIATGQADRGSRLKVLEYKPRELRQNDTREGQWYELGNQFVLLRQDWRQVRLVDLLIVYEQVGERYQPIDISDDQKAQIAAMIEELRKQERALGA